ncbi:MAG: ABC transporter substrate-binding protein [bacterium]|nr:ABC transporter substrate-binding protein [bacterium]
MTRLHRCVLTIVFLLIVSSFSVVRAQDAGACTPAEGEPLRLGAVFPQQSLLSAELPQAFQGAQAMLEAVNVCGGVSGRPVEWMLESARSRDEGEAAALRLIEAGVPLIVGSGSLAVSEGIREVAEREGVVFWEATEAMRGGQWSFSPRPNDQQLGSTAARFALEAAGDGLRVALVYKVGERGEAIATGVREGLTTPPLLELAYEGRMSNALPFARQVRDQAIDTVIVGAFDSDADALWFALREADANIQRWIHVGDAGYRQELCRRYVNFEGLFSISATGPLDGDYRAEALGDLYNEYRRTYMGMFSEEPMEQADLAAAGVYLLLRLILPEVEGQFTAESIRTAIVETQLPEATGLMGEGFVFDAVSGTNANAAAVVQQHRENGFCTVWPAAGATCTGDLLPFPTWRERALLEETNTCRDAAC